MGLEAAARSRRHLALCGALRRSLSRSADVAPTRPDLFRRLHWQIMRGAGVLRLAHRDAAGPIDLTGTAYYPDGSVIDAANLINAQWGVGRIAA
jgi:hypothetical protein